MAPIAKKQKKVLLFFSWSILSLFAGLRLNSPDYSAYKQLFENLNDDVYLNADVSMVANDPGFFILNKLIGCVSESYVVFFVLIACLSVGINLCCYRKYTPFFFTAVLLYFAHTYLLRELIQIRAGLACAICLYSVRFIVDRRFIPFLIVVFMATSIHLAAMSFLFTYFLCRLDISMSNWLKIIAISLFLGLFFPLGQFIKTLPDMEVLERVQTYSDWEQFSNSLGVFSNITVLKSLFIGLLGIIYFERLKKNYAFKILLDIYLLSLCWLVLFNDFNIVAGRIATFFSIGEVVLCASFYTLFNRVSRYICAILLSTFAFLMLALKIFMGKMFEYQMVLFF